MRIPKNLRGDAIGEDGKFNNNENFLNMAVNYEIIPAVCSICDLPKKETKIYFVDASFGAENHETKYRVSFLPKNESPKFICLECEKEEIEKSKNNNSDKN